MNLGCPSATLSSVVLFAGHQTRRERGIWLIISHENEGERKCLVAASATGSRMKILKILAHLLETVFQVITLVAYSGIFTYIHIDSQIPCGCINGLICSLTGYFEYLPPPSNPLLPL